MPSPLHEGILDILRARPGVTARLVARVLGDRALAREYTRVHSGSFEQSRSPEYSADLVLAFGEPTPRLAVVIEVQLRPDRRKLLTWPAYAAMLRARLGCPVVVLVFCVAEATARWASQIVRIGPGANAFQVAMLGPAQVAQLKTPRTVEVAVLRALAASRTSGALDSAWQAVQALQGAQRLEDETARYYYDLVANALSEAERQKLETMMKKADPNFDTPLVRRLLKLGRKQGLEEGQALALLAVLEARGLPVSESQRAEVLACRDQERLTRWIAAAVRCGSCAEPLAQTGGPKARRVVKRAGRRTRAA